MVPHQDRITGPTASIVMASFTHCSTHCPTRFSNGEYGVYYAAKSMETAIKETVYHREQFLSFTKEPSCKVTMRVYKSQRILKPLVDLRHNEYKSLVGSDDYTESQKIGSELKKLNVWGAVYPSRRHQGRECVGIFRPSAVPLPLTQTKHLDYVWNGQKITHIVEVGPELCLV